MSEEQKNIASQEIFETLRLCNFCIRRIGLSFLDDVPKSISDRLKTYLSFMTSSSLLILMLAGEIANIAGQMVNKATIEDFVGSYLHIAGYDTMSFGKLLTIWYKRNTFRQLVIELADIWPVVLKDKEADEIKRNSLSSLKHRQFLYAFWNVFGVWLYNLTPIAVLLYRRMRGVPADLGYVWQMAYPFDKTKPVYHELVYIFETCSGVISVCCMLGSDLLFMTMASHISMLLRLLQEKIRRLGFNENVTDSDTKNVDCYKEIVSVVKIHQRLISYSRHLEDAFSVVNLINVLLSSVNICCVVFTIVFLESWMEMSNKFFLGAALTQMGIVCWYADDIYRASLGVSDAVYESGWYCSSPRCRRAMLVVLQRIAVFCLFKQPGLTASARAVRTWLTRVKHLRYLACAVIRTRLCVNCCWVKLGTQKPLYFTALKFRAITMMTYSSILTTSYSYFTLLYTSYRRD